MSVAASSVVSESRKNFVQDRDNNQCILCGIDVIQVAHILGRNPSWAVEANKMVSISPDLEKPLFERHHSINLISLCPTHHVLYDMGYFILCPSHKNRQIMIDFEVIDFNRRQDHANQTGKILTRDLPLNMDLDIQFITITAPLQQVFTHLATPYDNGRYMFDNQLHPPGLIRNISVSPWALLYEASRFMGIETRFRTDEAEAALDELRSLLRLYEREPSVQGNNSLASSMPVDASISPEQAAFGLTMDQWHTSHTRRSTVPLQSQSQHPMTFAGAPLMTVDDGTASEGSIDDLPPLAKAELEQYRKEPGVLPEELEGRAPFLPDDRLRLWWGDDNL